MQDPTPPEVRDTADTDASGNRWLERLFDNATLTSVSDDVWVPPGMGSAMPRELDVSSDDVGNDELDVIVQLDVSVGIDDVEILKTIDLQFSGLPPSARLTHGTESTPGNWQVNALDLANLCVLMPPACPDFDLLVEMENADHPPQSARIRVSASAGAVQSNASVVILSVGPSTMQDDIRFKVYADGVPVFDRVINWSEKTDARQRLSVPISWGDKKPFELLIRWQGTDANHPPEEGPVLYSIETPDGDIVVPSAAMSGRYQSRNQGVSWRGDLTVSLMNFADGPLDDVPPPSEETAAPVDFVAQAAMPTVAPPAEEDMEDMVGSAQKREVINAETLELHIDTSDLHQHAFVDELRNLKDFVLAHGDGDHESVYERLSINVGKWHNMRVIGPSGADVELDAQFPSLGPLGGLDGGRPLYHVAQDLSDTQAPGDIRISGLPAGTILTHGRNLGDGCWIVDGEALDKVAVLAPIGHLQTIRVLIEPVAFERGGAVRTALVGGVLANLTPPTETMNLLPFPIPLHVFDPENLGSLAITVGDLPPGVMLNMGSNHGNGIWSLECNSDVPLVIAIPHNQGMFEASVTCVATGDNSAESSVVTRRVRFAAALDYAEVEEPAGFADRAGA